MNTAIIVASGMGTRMNADIPKQFLELNNKPILVRTLNIFFNHKAVDKIILVISKDMQENYNQKIAPFLKSIKPLSIVYGGKERWESVNNALETLEDNTKLVIIHDGVRPFVKNEEIDKVITIATEKGAAILAKPITDTVKLVKDGVIFDTPDRSTMYGAMTPQVFKYHTIMEAYQKLKIDNKMFMVTDDAMVVERFVQEVYIVEGSHENIKITNPIDLILGKAILDSRGEK